MNTSEGPAADVFTVVVGVSPTTRSSSALTWASHEASARGGRVIAVRAWRPLPPTYTGNRPPMHSYEPTSAHAEAVTQLVDDVTSVLGSAHQVECRLVEGGRRKVLLAQAHTADLLVLDAPRKLRSPGGAVFAHRLVYSTPCPVVIMPHAHPAEPSAKSRRGHTLGDELIRAAGTAGRPGIRPPSRDETP